MHEHSCIKCSTQYQDEDPDPYYCPACVEVKRQVAAEIDAKRPKGPVIKTPSNLEAFEAVAKTMKSASGGLATFARASDLM